MTPLFKPNFLRHNTLPSTNSELRRLLKNKDLSEGSIVMCQNQNNGRGQGSNSWESQANKNLTFSILLRPIFLEPHLQFYISKIISLAIVDTLSEYICGITIKWPNDIYIGDKKIAGILIENSIMGAQLDYSIVGIGLNVNQTVFVTDAPNPISLKIISASDFNLEKILNTTIKHIQLRYQQLMKYKLDEINKSYFGLLYRNIGKHPYRDDKETFMASIKGVSEMGMLILKDSSGKQREYAFKEVEFVI